MFGVLRTNCLEQGSVVIWWSWITWAANNATCPKTSVPVTVKLLLLHGDSQLIILADGIRCIGISTIAAASPCNMICNTNGTWRCRSLRGCTDGSRRLCSYLSCETTAVEIFQRDRILYKTIPTDRLGGTFFAIRCIHTSKWGAHLVPDIVFYVLASTRRQRFDHYILCTMWQWHVRLTLNASKHMLHNIFCLFCRKQSPHKQCTAVYSLILAMTAH